MDQSAEYIRTCYDAVAQEYAARFAGEFAHKPLDRQLLSRFATEVRERGDVCDLECRFVRVEVIKRGPYPDVEYPSRRAYVFASKPPTAEGTPV